MAMRGAVAAGHEQTAEAAVLILEAGGNAFDAAVAGLCAACVAEPVLASLGGGGFLMARPASGPARLYDFFVQTPMHRRPAGEQDFHPIIADFGTACQEFHIGLGSIATPGTLRGLFDVHRDLGSLPMARIVEPAIESARRGIRLNELQSYIFSVVGPIYRATAGARAIYCSPTDPERLPSAGESLRQNLLADTLEILALEGDRLFYEGELAGAIADACATGGGNLQMEDLRAYRTVVREPLTCHYRGRTLITNPPPSSGGLLIAFALELLAETATACRNASSTQWFTTLARVMELTNRARSDHGAEALTGGNLINRYRELLRSHPATSRGTTHISVVDAAGNAAALSISNGEGCGFVLPGTGIMLNNMLGEEDLNPDGFHCWQTGVRVSSMMAPTLVLDSPRLIAVGSGGSNRLRTAILQTLCGLIDHGLDMEAAVHAPRIHVERGTVHMEDGIPEDAARALIDSHDQHQRWPGLNLFFGGTHTVSYDGQRFEGAGDPRRGGAMRICH